MAWHFPEGAEVVTGRVGGMEGGPAVCGGMGRVHPPETCLTLFISGYLRRKHNSFLELVPCVSYHTKNTTAEKHGQMALVPTVGNKRLFRCLTVQ